MATTYPVKSSFEKSREVDDPERPLYYNPHTNTTGPVYVSDLEVGLRMAFIRKVYLVLSAQLIFTSLFCLFMRTHAPARAAFLNVFGSPGVVLLTFLGVIILTCALHPIRSLWPWNVIGLSVWTLLMSVLISFSVLYYSVWSVLVAVSITAAIFTGLTAYTFITKKDFSFLGPILFMGIISLLVSSLFVSIFNVPIMHTLFAAAGAIVFSGFILFDTSLIVQHFTVDDWVPAAVQLYLDVTNLFLSVLQLIGNASDRN